MDTICINNKNSKTSESNRFRLYFTDKLDLKRNKTVALANLAIYYTWQNIKEKYKNNKFKINVPTWDETFDLPDGSYTIANIQDYFLFIIKKREADVKSNEESPILIYPNEMKNRIVFKIKTGNKLELLTDEKMRLLGDRPIIDRDKNSKNVPELDHVDSVLLHCNIVQSDYLQNSRLLYTFVPDKTFGKLLSIQSKMLLQSKTKDSIFGYIEIWFTDQDNNSLQIEDKVNVTLIIQNNKL